MKSGMRGGVREGNLKSEEGGGEGRREGGREGERGRGRKGEVDRGREGENLVGVNVRGVEGGGKFSSM